MKGLSEGQERQKIRVTLQELGEKDEDIAVFTPILMQWKVDYLPEVDPAVPQRLVDQLAPLLPQPSAAGLIADRQAASPWARFVDFLNIARAQVSILRVDFWAVSACITLLGGLLTLNGSSWSEVTILWLIAPVLAVVGVHYGFQSAVYGMQELETACLVSRLRLTLARLLIVLSYDTFLLGALSMIFVVVWKKTSFGALILHWLAPLVFVTGISLALSMRFSLRTALMVGYAAWMAFVSLSTRGLPVPSLQLFELAFLLFGLISLIFTAVIKNKPQMDEPF